MRGGCHGMGGGHGHGHTEVDVVCGMEVDPNTSRFKSVYGGRTYYFCSEQCKGKFDAEPGKYVR